MTEYLYMLPPWGRGEPQRFEARPDVIVPLMNTGWSQCDPPATSEEEVTEHVG